jgi:hypothetical protein
MRRLAIFCLPLIALAAPATATALGAAARADGTLVVQNGTAPARVPVVTLVIIGTALGHVSTGSPDQTDTVIVDDQTVNSNGDIAANAAPGAFLTKAQLPGTTRTKFVGSDFRFRAAGGAYKIWIYGTGVNVFAVGKGTVVVQGMANTGAADGRYSVDGGDWHSLPSVPSDLLHFPTTG